ncbi:MAG: hypothetical protein K2K23_00115, partial [Muribaculaceae bacterium]|nr:hypothetical protein [Muribaculaceae bacterium]
GIAYICKLYDYSDEWLRLYDILRLFPLKGALLYGLATPEGCLRVAERQSGKNSDKIDMTLLQNIFFLKSCDCMENLSRNSESRHLTEKQRQKSQDLMNDFQVQQRGVAEKFIDFCWNTLGIEKTVTWIVDLYKRYNEENRFTHFQCLTANLLNSILKGKIENIDPKLLSSSNYENLLFYLSSLDKKNTEIDGSLIASLMKVTYSGFFQMPETNEEGFEKLRGVYTHLSGDSKETWAKVCTFRHATEGFKVDDDDRYHTVNGDVFWLSVLLLQLESTADKENLRFLAELALESASNSLDRGNFFISLYIAELIVSQVIPEYKDWFELKLINEYCDLVEVLRIMSANNGAFSDKVKAALKRRVDREWKLEKEIKGSYNKEMLEFLDEFLHRSHII